MKQSPKLAMIGLALAALALPTPTALANEASDGNLSTKDPRVTEAILDLAQRQGISATQVRVVSYQEGMWSDGSRGCPQPGFMYTMALVPGTRLVMEAAGTTFVYPNGGYCATPGGAFYPGLIR